MNSTLPGIKYVKAIRICAYNRRVSDGSAPRGSALLYDYEVLQHKVKIATFVREGHSFRYYLRDLDDKVIRIPESIRLYIALKTKNFDAVLGQALEHDAIPTEAVLAKRREQEEQAALRYAQLAKVEDLLSRKGEQAEAMYALLQDIIDKTPIPIDLMVRLNTITTFVEGK